MINDKFDSQIIEAVHEIHKRLEGKVVFAGSFGLKYNGLLDRTIGDLDVFTYDNMYATRESEDILNRSSSGHFFINGISVNCVHGQTSNGVSVDYMYKEIPLEFDVVNFYGIEIKIEKPEHAINAKRDYANNNSQAFINRLKHENDLRIIENNSDDLPF